MDALKRWLLLSLVALLAILAGGWSLLVAPQRSEAADLRAQAEAAQLTNAQLETQLEVLRAKAEELPGKRAELAEVAEKVPAGASLPALVRALTGAAREAGVVLTSVTPGTPVPLAAAAPAAATPAASAPAAADPAAAAAAAAPVDPAAAGGSGVSEIPVVLEVEGGFYELEQFLAVLEDLPRAVRLTSLVVQADSAAATTRSSALRSTVTASAFMTADAAAGAPAAAASAAPVVQGATEAGTPAPTAGPAAPPTGTAR